MSYSPINTFNQNISINPAIQVRFYHAAAKGRLVIGTRKKGTESDEQ